MSAAIGILELSSIAGGYVVQDRMLKAADVRLLVARTICPGKYLVIVGGRVDGVRSAMASGRLAAEGSLVDELFIPNVAPAVFPALSGCVELAPAHTKALGIVETFSSASVIQAADAAAKAADVTLFRIHVAMAIGGKGFMLVGGDVAAVSTAVEAGANHIREQGLLVNKVVISGASPELFREHI